MLAGVGALASRSRSPSRSSSCSRSSRRPTGRRSSPIRRAAARTSSPARTSAPSRPRRRAALLIDYVLTVAVSSRRASRRSRRRVRRCTPTGSRSSSRVARSSRSESPRRAGVGQDLRRARPTSSSSRSSGLIGSRRSSGASGRGVRPLPRRRAGRRAADVSSSSSTRSRRAAPRDRHRGDLRRRAGVQGAGGADARAACSMALGSILAAIFLGMSVLARTTASCPAERRRCSRSSPASSAAAPLYYVFQIADAADPGPRREHQLRRLPAPRVVPGARPVHAAPVPFAATGSRSRRVVILALLVARAARRLPGRHPRADPALRGGGVRLVHALAGQHGAPLVRRRAARWPLLAALTAPAR